MQNKICIFILSLFAVAACTTQTGYKLDGTVADQSLNGSHIYMMKTSGADLEKIDSALIKDGKFQFTGKQDTAAIRLLSLENKKSRRLTFVLENGKIKAVIDSFPTVSGTPLNDSLQVYANNTEAYYNKTREMRQTYMQLKKDSALTAEIEDSMMNVSKKTATDYLDQSKAMVHSNLNNIVGAFIFSQLSYDLNETQMNELVSKAGPVFKSYEPVQKVISYLETLAKSAVGKPFINMTMKDPAGKEVSLSDYVGKGKYVLIDFWASWCGPCRQEMPFVVAAYGKFKSKGFEIVGVSFDEDNAKWEKSIKELGITWPQMSDLKGWESLAATTYGINSIPQTILIDPQGIIIEKNLRGDALDKKLTELLK